MVGLAARLDVLSRRTARVASPPGVVVIYPTTDEHGGRLSEEAIRRWQDAAVRKQPPGVRAVIFLPAKDADR